MQSRTETRSADTKWPAPTARFDHLETVWFQITGTVCNLRCSHCFISCAPDNHTLEFLSREQVESYLAHHGAKLVQRFDARSYVALTRAMDLHDVAAGHGGLDEALDRISAPMLAVGISSDVLYLPHELQSTVNRLQRLGTPASYTEIVSPAGHDAFLIEYDQLNRLVSAFLEQVDRRTSCAC